MKPQPETAPPADADRRKAIKPVICYPVDSLPPRPMDIYRKARQDMVKVDEILARPRDAACFHVPAGHFFRIVSVEGSQVGDLNLWNASDLSERFYSGKTRALHGTHVSTGDRLWSGFPFLRPMATVTRWRHR